MTVVLGGSRNLNRLPEEVTLRLQTWSDQGVDFLVGDAPGIEAVFQAWLRRSEYRNVRVFTSAPEVRNNLGNWPVVRVDSGLRSRGSAMHTAKDREMTRIADAGLMMWDGESAGTLANVLDLAGQGKDAYLYVDRGGDLWHFEGGLGLGDFVRDYEGPLAEAEKRLRQYAKRKAKRVQEEHSDTLFGDLPWPS